jgi:hypothetical protein
MRTDVHHADEHHPHQTFERFQKLESLSDRLIAPIGIGLVIALVVAIVAGTGWG